jgi:hypothetical protein
MNPIGRYCELNGLPEISDLRPGLDFRNPQYRREVFLRFYEFHLKYRAHAGAVYYAFPYLFERLGMDMEQRLWFTFINGCSQNVITTYLIWEQFPNLRSVAANPDRLTAWFRHHYPKLGWDTDRRYVKNQFETCVKNYIGNLRGRPQLEFFSELCASGDPYKNFKTVWDKVITDFYLFGRLATFSYTEYLRIAGLPLDCDSLFLDDISGSKSHRNGLCKVLGRDDMDWWKEPVTYTPEWISYLTAEGEALLSEARARFNHPDLSYFTLETTLCCYKSWHRPNRRYPNVYNDMFHGRILYATKQWKDANRFGIFWDCRRASLPRHLLLEYNPKDVGVDPVKQNHYLKTGQVIMMDREWECFANQYNDYTR